MKFESKTLFSSLDRRRSIPLGEVSKITGIPLATLRDYVNAGRIPGAFRITNGKGAKWRFKRDELEIWWRLL